MNPKELPFKTWKAQMVRRDVEYALSIVATSGKVHVITVPHLKLLARDLALSMDLKYAPLFASWLLNTGRQLQRCISI